VRVTRGVGGLSGAAPLGKKYGLGYSITGAGDIDQDGIPDIVAGAPGDDNDGNGPKIKSAGAAWVFFMNADGTVRDFVRNSSSSLPTTLAKKYGFGTDVHGIDNAQANGITNLIVGVPGYVPTHPESGKPVKEGGAAFLLSLDSTGQVLTETILFLDTPHLAEKHKMRFGTSVASLGDRDGDGIEELLIGAPGSDEVAKNAGLAFQVSVNDSQAIKSVTPIFPNPGLEAKDGFGTGAASVEYACYTLAFIGATGDDDSDDGKSMDLGAVWVQLPSTLQSKSPKLSADDQQAFNNILSKFEAPVELSAENTHLRLYPNPTTGKLNIEVVSKERERAQVSIVDLLGNRIYFWEGEVDAYHIHEANLSEVRNGQYFVQLIIGKEVMTGKVIIHR